MPPGARTPEELEWLLEDAFVCRDALALLDMFEDGAVLIATGGREARGAKQIRRLARALVGAERGYLAEPRRIVQARDTALVVGSDAISVVRRTSGDGWRYVIALLADDESDPNQEEQR